MYGKPRSRSTPSTRGCSGTGNVSQDPSVTCSMARTPRGSGIQECSQLELPLPAACAANEAGREPHRSSQVPGGAEGALAPREWKTNRGRVKAGGGGQAGVVPAIRRCRLGSGRLSTPSRRWGGRDSAPAPAFSANWRQMAAPYRVLAGGQRREDRHVPQLRSRRFTVMQNRVDVGI